MGTDRHTVRTSWEEKGRDCGEAAEEAKNTSVPLNHQELEDRCGKDSLSEPSEGTNPAITLILDSSSPEL